MKINTTNISKLFFRIIIFSIFLLTIISCDERWEEMNNDPNRLTELSDEYLFNSAVRSTFRDGYGLVDIDFGGQYAHIFISDVWHREIDKYNSFNSQRDFPEQLFTYMYQGAIKHANEATILTQEGKFENEMRNAQAQIINMLNFAKLTDLFGDIPYSEGGMGKFGILEPIYDTQSDIYSDMVLRLKNSIDILKAGDPEMAYPKGVDPVYDGDVDGWIRFTNSFRLRLAVRARHADPTKYNAIITECLAEDLIEENSQNATIENWDSEDGTLYNPWYNKIIELQDVYSFLWSEFFIELLKSSNDPRLPFFATMNINSEYIGMPNGLADTHESLPSFGTWDKSLTSQPTPEFFAKDQPSFVITAAEVWLMRAELALYSLGPGDPNTMYQTGIERAMSQWGIATGEINNFLATETEATLNGTTDNQFRQIATQMYISFVPNCSESWFTIRRTGYPVIPQRTADNFSKGVTNGNLPVRLNYPNTIEASVNWENLQIAIDRLGGDDRIDIPVWWDVN